MVRTYTINFVSLLNATSRYLDNPERSKLGTDIDRPPKASASPRWPSPAFPGLIGNILPEYLSFSRFPFPPRANVHQPFPTLQETHEYLLDVAKPYIQQGKIRLNMEVVNIEEQPQGQGWKVSTRDWNEGKTTGEKIEEIWDAVVVAVGWYDNPVWPETPGLDILRERGLAVHAKEYRGPQGNEGKVRPFPPFFFVHPTGNLMAHPPSPAAYLGSWERQLRQRHCSPFGPDRSTSCLPIDSATCVSWFPKSSG